MMLVRTPRPYTYESLPSYILRLSEENGYSGPSDVLRLIGYRTNAPNCPAIDVNKLEKLLGARKHSLTHLSHHWPGDKTSPDAKARDFRFLGHKLSFVSAYKPIRTADCAVCPACVRENGYLDAFWELKLAVACPIHRTSLLSVCPHCKRNVTWTRQGLLRCKCGGSLDVPCTELSSESLLRLMTGLRAAVHRVPRVGLEWDFWRLSRLLHTLYSFPKLHYRFKDRGPTIAQLIQSILDEWPGFEMKLIELDVDSYFHNPWTSPKRGLCKEEKELLKEKYDRQMEVSFYDEETWWKIRMFELLERADKIEAYRIKKRTTGRMPKKL